MIVAIVKNRFCLEIVLLRGVVAVLSFLLSSIEQLILSILILVLNVHGCLYLLLLLTQCCAGAIVRFQSRTLR